MGTILDYITWRGDLTFKESAFNEIDALIFCEFAYLKLNSIVPQEFTKRGITIGQAAEAFFSAPDIETRSDMGILFGENVVNLFRLMAQTKRYSQLKLCGFEEHFDQIHEKQFAAITLLLGDGSFFVIFRGTDDTLVGWKEDFNMCFMTPVPAQEAGLNYLRRAASRLSGKIRLGGHSKGGNVSVYSAIYCGKRMQKRITDIYNFDGPGFDQEIFQTEEFQLIEKKIRTYIPNQSIVGLLLEHEGDYTIVKSQETGLMQHNLLSWQLDGPKFEEVQRVSDSSILIERSVRHWLKDHSIQEREEFVDALFLILSSSQASSLSELAENWKKNPAKALNSLLAINPQNRRIVRTALSQLFKMTHQELKLDFKNWFHYNSLIKK